MSGMGAHPGMCAYSTNKAALISLCQVLTQEWAADGINVIIVSPGMIRRPLTYEVYENNKIAKDRSALIPLGRVGEAHGHYQYNRLFVITRGRTYDWIKSINRWRFC